MVSRQRVQQMFEEVLKEAVSAGLPIPSDKDWMTKQVVFMDATSKYGDCHYAYKDPKNYKTSAKKECRVRISTFHLHNTEEQVRGTLAHEICHTCPGHGHGAEWKHWAGIMNKAYGYNISRLGTSQSGATLAADRTKGPTKGHVVKCRECGKEYHRSRNSNLTLHPEHYFCGECHGKLYLVY